MRAKRDRYDDDDKAVTVALAEDKIVVGSCYGDVSWEEWCVREKWRMNASGDDGGNVRIARGGGVMWLTRG